MKEGYVVKRKKLDCEMRPYNCRSLCVRVCLCACCDLGSTSPPSLVAIVARLCKLSFYCVGSSSSKDHTILAVDALQESVRT